ncbi:hypothetical protein EAI_17355 [Harpegnathos saltator]|uniref:Uncharacterized protein n=1 Tax=Harpegnathos saltator TaxID=610380 RepID=E2C317_HARSA|nr:hypothetical protein EAI_17355 [Harpegnathos saltator]
MVLVKLGSVEQKRKMMEAKEKLRGRRERIEDDLTEEERKAKWRIEREAEVERREGKNVQVGYMKMWVNGRMKRWDEVILQQTSAAEEPRPATERVKEDTDPRTANAGETRPGPTIVEDRRVILQVRISEHSKDPRKPRMEVRDRDGSREILNQPNRLESTGPQKPAPGKPDPDEKTSEQTELQVLREQTTKAGLPEPRGGAREDQEEANELVVIDLATEDDHNDAGTLREEPVRIKREPEHDDGKPNGRWTSVSTVGPSEAREVGKCVAEAEVSRPPPHTDQVGPTMEGVMADPTMPDPPSAERPRGVSEAEKMEMEVSATLLAEAGWEEWRV